MELSSMIAQSGEHLKLAPRYSIDSEVIIGIALSNFQDGGRILDLPERVLSLCTGTVACAVFFPSEGKLLLFSNNGSLYLAKHSRGTYFSSERFPLEVAGCSDIVQIGREGVELDIPKSNAIEVTDIGKRTENLIPSFKNIAQEESLLEFAQPDLKRCRRCILPETMPFISFDSFGVCNYCNSYKPRNNPKPKVELFDLVKRYRRKSGPECIIPFSGGRDSCYGLHLVINELKMRAITYTYDWGMVTDLGRRNISRMSAKLGVENIIVADDISRKRRNIAMNLRAWLKRPHLGMISILTAGDKHFFRHVDTVRRQTGVSLNLWGVNPLEVTHFKAGFLGVPPDFEEKRVYMHGVSKQLYYQYLRTKAMLKSPGYFNRSLWDSLSGGILS
jgi:glucosamine--fructose-6-phosphate aminotransferase (isomerizing)